MFKYIYIFLLFLSFLFSDSVEHNYNSAIHAYTKTPKPGRVNLGLDLAQNNQDSYYDSKGESHSLTNFDKYSIGEIALYAKYHGVNGAGYNFIILSEAKKWDNFEENNIIKEDDNITFQLGYYLVWNEVYEHNNPAVISGHQYTFPSTRIVSGLNLVSMKNDVSINGIKYKDETYSALNAFTSFDLIIGSKTILSSILSTDLVDDDNINLSFLRSKIVYDFNENVSFSPGLSYEFDNESNYIFYGLLEGGYQFRKLKYGHFNSTIKINPYFKVIFSGENMDYKDTMYGLSFKLLFN